jgi:acyl carrier protein
MNESTDRPIRELRENGLWNAFPIEERRQRLAIELRALVAELLAVPESDDLLQAPASTLGVDSLQAFEIESEWELRTGIKMDVTSLLQGGSLSGLIEGLLTDGVQYDRMR